jgi:hypothetical protein
MHCPIQAALAAEGTATAAHAQTLQATSKSARWPARASTGQKLFMRVGVDPHTNDPEGTPELVTSGTTADDFCTDGRRRRLVTTHRENTIDRAPLEPNSGLTAKWGGQPFTELLLGP